MGSDTLAAGETDRNINAWLRDYFERQLEQYGLSGTHRGWPWHLAAKKGMVTQAGLAEAIGMSESGLSRRMSGEQRWRTIDVDLVARYLGVKSATIQKGPRKK